MNYNAKKHYSWTFYLIIIIFINNFKLFIFYSELIATTPCKAGIINCNGGVCGHFSIKFCRPYQNLECSREICKYVHVSKGEELTYRQTGHVTERLKIELLTKGQHPNICMDYYVNRRCTYNDCTKLHFSVSTNKLKCPVCREEIRQFKLRALTCNHIICGVCADLLDPVYGREHSVKCPLCRGEGDVIELL